MLVTPDMSWTRMFRTDARHLHRVVLLHSLELAPERANVGPDREVGVRVDDPGHHGMSGQVDDPGAVRDRDGRRVAHGFDPLTSYDDDLVVASRLARAVDEPTGPDRRHFLGRRGASRSHGRGGAIRGGRSGGDEGRGQHRGPQGHRCRSHRTLLESAVVSGRLSSEDCRVHPRGASMAALHRRFRNLC